MFISIYLYSIRFSLTEGFSDIYNQKVTAAGQIEPNELIQTNFNNKSDLRSITFYLAERDLRYHFKIGNQHLFTMLSATTNLSYNVSYILNTPVKLYRNIKVDIEALKLPQLKNEPAQDPSNTDKVIEKTGSTILITNDVINAGLGIIFALIMIVFGIIIGFIYHPLQTFFDLIPCVWLTVKTVYYAVAHFFSDDWN